jgi:hypothetical protein
MFDGNLGGLSGADAKCQQLAAGAGFSGTFKAWLSDSTQGPAARFSQSTVPYILVDGTVVAANWAQLTSGNLQHPINLTEKGTAAPIGNTACNGGGFRTVMTNTLTDGTSLGGQNCNNWTSNAVNGAAWGLADSTGPNWTVWCSGGTCAWVSPLYCFQQ